MIKRAWVWPLVFAVAVLAATTQPAVAAPASDSHAVIHVVQPGENLFRISLRYGVSMASIVQVNGLANASSISVGQRLIIPSAANPGLDTAAVPTEQSADGLMHIVQPGENLFRIGLRYGVSVAQLQVTNQLPGINIFVGQQLRIPSGAVVATSAALTGSDVAASSTAPAASGEAKEIVVDLSEQRVYLYENGSLVRTMIASTGVAATPTVLGTYRIYLHHPKQRFSRHVLAQQLQHADESRLR